MSLESIHFFFKLLYHTFSQESLSVYTVIPQIYNPNGFAALVFGAPPAPTTLALLFFPTLDRLAIAPLPSVLRPSGLSLVEAREPDAPVTSLRLLP